MRVIKGKPQGQTMMITTFDSPTAAPNAIDAFLDQSHNHITVTSAFGTIAFHRDDIETVKGSLVALADFIERNVVL